MEEGGSVRGLMWVYLGANELFVIAAFVCACVYYSWIIRKAMLFDHRRRRPKVACLRSRNGSLPS